MSNKIDYKTIDKKDEDEEYPSVKMFELPSSEYYEYSEETARMDYEIPSYSFEEEDKAEKCKIGYNEYDIAVKCAIFDECTILERKDILDVKMPILDEYGIDRIVPVVIKYICPICEEIKEDKIYVERRYLEDSRNPIRQYFIS